MCTLTFIPNKNDSILLAMNRDESRSRAKACNPVVFNRDGVIVTHPFEPSTGTWVSTNSFGVSFALLNWYSVSKDIEIKSPRSRGFLVKDISTSRSPSGTEERLLLETLQQTMPFRLVGFFPTTREIVEWRWNGFKLENLDFQWEQNMWASSGFNEPVAQRKRRITLENLEHPKDVSTTQFLRNFHSSHEPEPGPFSVCMHREEAETLSYTEIETNNEISELRYFPGPLCRNPKATVKQVKISNI